MKRVLILIAALLSLASVAAKAGNHVVDLTDSDLDSELEGREWVVEFYAKWCGACQRFTSEYENAAAQLHKERPELSLGRVDVDANPVASARFMISRLPTIYHVLNKTARPMEVRRTAADVVEYLTEERWRSVEPLNAWYSPFSVGGHILGTIGGLGSHLVNFAQTLRTLRVEQWAYIGAGGFVLILLLGRLFADTPTPGPPRRETKKSK
ncbi:thioredoxin-like protein [Fimicolochytrium jonesii]|uniref:thioredoxin-like protein n=1 Tax=Fimicolochytrium jonesii TaxID=1396493 RepID=UPI0022FDFEDC|nr:thioredoxin-like protein [Fimicolochytrium jonesii]KAI8825854.1 thioredoxin-like protein [Fimicolochytrium jonesii]